MYQLRDYLSMLSDENRISAYADAIRSQVKPGDRVIELGAGFGFFSILAVRAGAAFVDAVDVNPVVHLGPRIAAANGYADRIRFHQLDLLRFQPDARADVVIGDLRGPTPFVRRSLEVMIDARTRMLRDGGQVIGRKDILYVAPVRHPAAFRRIVVDPVTRSDVNLSPAATVVVDTPFQCTVARGDLVAPAASWGELDYERLDTTSHCGSAEWKLDDQLQIDGLAIWFEADLGGGIRLSSGPGGSTTTYAQMYLPLRAPVEVEPAERLRVDLAARYSAGEYVWTWSVQISDANAVCRIRHTQNSLAERIIDPAAFETAAL